MSKVRENNDSIKESSAIKIRSIQAASLYRVNNGYKFVLRKANEDGCYSGLKEYREPFLDYTVVTPHQLCHTFE